MLAELPSQAFSGNRHGSLLTGCCLTQARATHPDNLMAKLFDFDYYMTLPGDMQARLLYICKSGAENADSG
jgi:hypothetical protein